MKLQLLLLLTARAAVGAFFIPRIRPDIQDIGTVPDDHQSLDETTAGHPVAAAQVGDRSEQVFEETTVPPTVQEVRVGPD